jgi:GrpB-like predicted nucleotidyltransferase (UPF0157 family)
MSWASRYPAGRLAAPTDAWASRFGELAGGLRRALGTAWEIEHVGSTSVPGLVAKPVIDLVVHVPDGLHWCDASEPLVQAGWTPPRALGDHAVTFRLVDGVRSAIGHLFTHEQWAEAHVRLFAEWLRAHRADRDAYAVLKRDLVARGIWDGDYTSSKGAFVLAVVNRARGARGLPPVTGPL